MKAFIRSTAAISAQDTLATEGLPYEMPVMESACLKILEPDYKEYINPAMLRRMGRVLRMGVAAASECLRRSGMEVPDAIVTGTGLGCIEDTENFLGQIIKNREQFLPPTSFIQSTHNTIGAQVALMIKCQGYNFTCVHAGISFEMALLDAMMLLAEGSARNVLAGGVDEITPGSFRIMQRLGLYKQSGVKTDQLLNSGTRGSIGGEGATFFVLDSEPGEALACIHGAGTFYNHGEKKDICGEIREYLASTGDEWLCPDAVLMGYNGCVRGDTIYNRTAEELFQGSDILSWKQFSGEYFTATAFATFAATAILTSGKCPPQMMVKKNHNRPLKNILIYNHFLGHTHSIILLSAC